MFKDFLRSPLSILEEQRSLSDSEFSSFMGAGQEDYGVPTGLTRGAQFSTTSPIAAPETGGWDWGNKQWDSFTGTKDKPGWGGLAVNTLSGVGSYIMGGKQLEQRKKESKLRAKEFNLDFGMRRQLMNQDIRHQGEMAYARRSNTGETPEEYFNRNKLV